MALIDSPAKALGLVVLVVLLGAALAPILREVDAVFMDGGQSPSTDAVIAGTVEAQRFSISPHREIGRIAFRLSTTGPERRECVFTVRWLDADGMVVGSSVARGPVPGTIAADDPMRPAAFDAIRSSAVEFGYCKR